MPAVTFERLVVSTIDAKSVAASAEAIAIECVDSFAAKGWVAVGWQRLEAAQLDLPRKLGFAPFLEPYELLDRIVA